MQNHSLQKNNKQKVLIADDDAPTRILLRTAIAQWDYEVIEARDGEEAWNILQTEDAPRLLILDWLMPKIDGITLCERCKSHVNNQTYIIMLTQLSGNENIIKGIEAGADEFLSKPFNMAELRTRLSIGSKIVLYGNEILKKTMEFHAYQKKVDHLANEIHQTTNLINKALSSTSDSVELKKMLAKLNTITQELMALNNNKEEV